MGSSYSSTFVNVFLHFYEQSFVNSVNFFRYIGDIAVFNSNNFKDISGVETYRFIYILD